MTLEAGSISEAERQRESERRAGQARTLEVIRANIALNRKLICATRCPQNQLIVQQAELLLKDAELAQAQTETIEPYLDSVEAYQHLQELRQQLAEVQQGTHW